MEFVACTLAIGCTVEADGKLGVGLAAWLLGVVEGTLSMLSVTAGSQNPDRLPLSEIPSKQVDHT